MQLNQLLASQEIFRGEVPGLTETLSNAVISLNMRETHCTKVSSNTNPLFTPSRISRPSQSLSLYCISTLVAASSEIHSKEATKGIADKK